MNKPFKEWINTAITDCNPDGGLPYKGKIFLTSRLDSGLQYDSNHVPTGNHAAAVEALIERSDALAVNKFACTIVIDSKDAELELFTRGYSNFMREQGWCVYYDDSTAFLHGLYQPQTSSPDCGSFSSSLEGQYVGTWPELVHYTLGRNVYQFGPSPTAEAVCNDYVKWYNPHPAGLFLSYESYNGIGLRDPGWPDPSDLAGPGWTHGSALHWIGRGGSFAIAGVNGMGSPSGTYSVPNLYQHGLSWAEAAWSEPIGFKSYACPIGDPLARVVVYNPDSNGDGVIDGTDLVAALEGEFDVNGDSLFDQFDVDRVLESLGRNRSSFPPLPPPLPHWPPTPVPTVNMCGDLNGDRIVNAVDLAIFDARIQQCGWDAYSGLFDVDHDYYLTDADHDIIEGNSDPPLCLYDANGDGCLDQADFDDVFNWVEAWGEVCDDDHPQWVSLYDVDCNNCIDQEDYKAIDPVVQHGYDCPDCPNP